LVLTCESDVYGEALWLTVPILCVSSLVVDSASDDELIQMQLQWVMVYVTVLNGLCVGTLCEMICDRLMFAMVLADLNFDGAFDD
jgi:hypothetical protein